MDGSTNWTAIFLRTSCRMISGKWEESFTWVGDGEMPAEERTKLQTMVQQAYAPGRVLGFGQRPRVYGEPWWRRARWRRQMFDLHQYAISFGRPRKC